MQVYFSNILLVVLLIAGQLVARAQTVEAERTLPLDLRAVGVGVQEVTVIITENNRVYVPLVETFTFLGIKFDYDTLNQRVRGFYQNEDNPYQITLSEEPRVRYQEKVLNVSLDDYILRNGALYLHIDFINSIFDLELVYNPRRLEVFVKNSSKLPVLTSARRLQLFQRRLLRKELPEPDLYLGRDYSPFSGGRINWAGTSRFTKSSYVDSRGSMNFGLKVLGGDFTGRLFATSRPGRTNTSFKGNLRYPLMDNSLIRQIIIGDHLDFGIVSHEVTGIEVTNRPPGIRRIFTREVFHGEVEPKMDITLSGSTSEAMFDQADERGLYQFDVPVLYGNGVLEVRAFDFWGQERLIRYRMTVPRSLIPPGEFEYSLSAGKIQSTRKDRTVVSNSLSWGLSSDLTIGSRLAYYDLTDGSRKVYGGLTGTARLSRNLIMTGFVTPMALSRLGLSLEFPSTARLNVNRRQYAMNSFFNPSSILHETDATILLPVYFKSSSITLNLFGSRTQYVRYRSDEVQAGVTGVFGNVSPTISTRVVNQKLGASEPITVLHLTNLSMSIQLPNALHLRGDISYDHRQSRVSNVSAVAIKRVMSRLEVGLSYIRLIPASYYSAGLRVTYFFPFAQVNGGASTSGSNQYEYTSSASGSLYFDVPNAGFEFFNRTSSIGSGGFDVRPFLDANANGIFDRGEERIDQGQVYYTNIDFGNRSVGRSVRGTTRNLVFGYERYNLNLDPQSLENPTWVPLHAGVQVLSEPNFLRRIEMPVVNGGIIRGSVFIKGINASSPAEGITIHLVSMNGNGNGNGKTKSNGNGDHSRKVKTVSTFSTGEFEFLGVPPGKYELRLDTDQIARLQFTAETSALPVSIERKPEGDIITDLQLTLIPR